MDKFIKRGNLVYIRKPDFEEIDYIKKLWSDEDTMRDVGGAIHYSEYKWENWYKRMVDPGNGKNFYCLIYNMENTPVGEVSFHGYDRNTKTADLNVKVENKYRGNNYGNEAVMLLLEYYFNSYGGEVIFDTVANENGIEALKTWKFEVLEEKGKEVLFRMTKENFNKMVEQ
ncbi:GNAT family N-acetyltransferase [Clostridium senegalense]|uniref:GNAT family N-acetyltransferase n=1 Tax=Clostridium senegalense TaxID=1465809 RepID=UPI00028A2AC9|nr:GNAT family N-acetyltransferase [Clostridium senegalense]MBU5227709.1 GNAT family N-acetyltransferase [Clostridium senegalense]